MRLYDFSILFLNCAMVCVELYICLEKSCTLWCWNVLCLCSKKIKGIKKCVVLCVTWFLPSWCSSPFWNRYSVDSLTSTDQCYHFFLSMGKPCDRCIQGSVDDASSFDLDVHLFKYWLCAALFVLWQPELRSDLLTEGVKPGGENPFPLWRHPWFFVTPVNISHLKTPHDEKPQSPAPFSESGWKPFAQNSIRTSMNMEVKAAWGDAFWRAEKRRRKINTQEVGSVICDISS